MGKRMLAGLFALFLLFLLGSAALAEDGISSKAMLNRLGRRIGVSQGSAAEEAVASEFPEATIVYFTDYLLGYTAVAQGKLDAFVADSVQMQLTIDNGLTGAHLLPEVMDTTVKIAVGYSDVSGIPDLKNRLNRFIAEVQADGTLDDMYRRWVRKGDSAMPEIPMPENPRLHLTVGTTGTVPPYSYYEGSGLTGFDIELARRFAAWLGADLSLQIYDFAGIVHAAKSGKIDVAMSNLQYLPERSEGLPFSDILYEEKLGIMVRGDAPSMAASPGKAVTSIAQLNDPNIRLGLPLSSAADEAVEEQLPLAQLIHYNDNLLGFMDVAQGRIDGFVYDVIGLKISMENGVTGVRILDEYMDRQLKICVGISPVSQIPDLEDKVNRFIAGLKSDGTMDDMFRRWVWDAERALPEIELPADPEYHLIVGTSGIEMPFSYYEGDALTGFDIEMAYRFAQWLGADLEFQVYDYGAIVPAAVSGKVDVVMANLQYTAERAESGLIYSDELYAGRIGILVRDDSESTAAASLTPETAGLSTTGGKTGAMGSFWDSIVSSFNKTFIRENRWRLFVQGVLTTLLITALTILFGTLLGFAVFMLCRNGNPVANAVTRFCLWLVQGTPMVVLLMILYYIIFGSVAISGVLVAVIGFTLTFGAAVFGLLKMGVGAVDVGQYEAAYALSFSNRRTFYRIILPQALPHVLPAYRGEIVGLIKATAIVGYIAVQDLTKMGDIVRSRTYEAFFPLIAVTVIYFALEGLIGFLVSRISLSFNLKRRKPADIVKGIKIDAQN